ncbi:MAG: hypothetical protein HY741_00165 [Chloroflexi bacterium]|nr:hypothetical protein [Chloroflexota bacterium]
MSVEIVPTRNELDAAWGAMHPAHCKNCRAGFLVPSHAGAPVCPNCLAARLEPLPALQADAPPELVIPFGVSDATLDANLERWLRAIPFKPASLSAKALRANLARIFLPLYLADARAFGTWQAQMGFDYLVASSEERFDGNGWVTQRLNETRVRWEPRAGELARKYENTPAPALEQHARWMLALGASNWREPPFDTSRAISFASEALNNAIVRVPDVAPNAAWQFAREQIERRAARECETASNAQHHEQFVLRAAYGEPHWTLLLLPTYVSSYIGDDGKWIPVRVNGQSGFVSGVKRASLKRAQRWAIVIGIIAFAAFMLTVLLGMAGALNDAFVFPALLVLVVTFFLCLAAPAPLIITWQFNRQNADDVRTTDAKRMSG